MNLLSSLIGASLCSIQVVPVVAFCVDRLHQKLLNVRVRNPCNFYEGNKRFILDRTLNSNPVKGLFMKKGSDQVEHDDSSSWLYLSEIVRINSRWMTVIAERFQDDNNKDIDYWRIERPSSAIVIVIQDNKLIFPKPQYRPGIDRNTLDFCGGRIPDGMEDNPILAVPGILLKELDFVLYSEGVDKNIEGEILPLNELGWAVDSSVSSQNLFGFIVTIQSSVSLNQDVLYEKKVDINSDVELKHLLKEELICLQCRALLMEWILQQRTT